MCYPRIQITITLHCLSNSIIHQHIDGLRRALATQWPVTRSSVLAVLHCILAIVHIDLEEYNGKQQHDAENPRCGLDER